jgi:hypothetical protein
MVDSTLRAAPLQRLARRAGLLTLRPFRRGPSVCPAFRPLLASTGPVTRRWLRRRRRVRRQQRFELGDLVTQRFIRRPQHPYRHQRLRQLLLERLARHANRSTNPRALSGRLLHTLRSNLNAYLYQSFDRTPGLESRSALLRVFGRRRGALRFTRGTPRSRTHRPSRPGSTGSSPARMACRPWPAPAMR